MFVRTYIHRVIGSDLINFFKLVSEASKRLPLTDLPKTIESIASDLSTSFASWGNDAMKGAEQTAMSVGGNLFDILQNVAGEAAQKAGEVLSHSLDAVGRTFKGYLAEWVGCSNG